MANELVTIDACVLLVMTTVGLVEAGMEVVDGMHAGGTKPRMLVVCREMPEHFGVRGDISMTPDHTAILETALDRVDPELI